MGDTIYIVEFRSISHGVGALDRMLKRAGVELLYANPICIGKYLICVCGDASAASVAKEAAEEPDTASPFASRLLTGVHPAIRRYFKGDKPRESEIFPAIGVFEAKNAASGFVSLDAALKSANVRPLRIWLGHMLGGKLCYVVGGGTSDVQSAIRAAQAAITESEHAGSRVIPSPDGAVLKLFLRPPAGM